MVLADVSPNSDSEAIPLQEDIILEGFQNHHQSSSVLQFDVPDVFYNVNYIAKTRKNKGSELTICN